MHFANAETIKTWQLENKSYSTFIKHSFLNRHWLYTTTVDINCTSLVTAGESYC